MDETNAQELEAGDDSSQEVIEEIEEEIFWRSPLQNQTTRGLSENTR